MSIEGFALRKGDTYNWKLQFDDGGTPATPIDITGRTLTFTVKSALTDTDENALVQVATTFQAGADSTAGIGYIFIPHTETENLVPGAKVYYDFQMAYTDSQSRLVVNTLAAGTVKVDWEVTLSVPT